VVHINPLRKEERRKGSYPPKIIHGGYELVLCPVNLQREEER
jgi:hypothetical protein